MNGEPLAELSQEVLDLISRLDGLAERVQGLEATVARERGYSHGTEDEVDGVLAEQRALASRLADLEHSDLETRLSDRIERSAERLERSLGALERRVDNHEGDHWRERR